MGWPQQFYKISQTMYVIVLHWKNTHILPHCKHSAHPVNDFSTLNINTRSFDENQTCRKAASSTYPHTQHKNIKYLHLTA